MNYILHKIAIVIILSLIALFSCITFGLKITELRNKTMFLELDIQMLKKKLNAIHKEIDNAIIENNLANNIIATSEREDFLLLIKVIAKDYNFTYFSPNIFTPIKVNFKKQDFFDIMFTRITLDFQTDSEIKVYAFIDELIDKIPGYVTIKSIKSIQDNGTILSSVELNSYTLVAHNN